MSSDIEELVMRHFSTLDEEEEEFTSNQSMTHSQLPGQLEVEEARELEEVLRLSAHEAMNRQKKKGKMIQKAPQEVGESSTATMTPTNRKANSETSTSSPSLERNIPITTH